MYMYMQIQLAVTSTWQCEECLLEEYLLIKVKGLSIFDWPTVFRIDMLCYVFFI